MNAATIGWGWPSRDAAALDDEQLAGCYAINDRSRQSVRVNFVASIDGAATADGLSAGTWRQFQTRATLLTARKVGLPSRISDPPREIRFRRPVNAVDSSKPGGCSKCSSTFTAC